MTLIRKLAWVLCLVGLHLNYSNAQELIPGQQYTTQNIVQQTQQGGPSTWTNGVYQDNLNCWAWGMFGYCGPNPTVRPGNNINFSYGLTNLYQVQAIANVLPATQTGLRVDGYNFGFTAKNGNGWDDGRVDQLNAYVKFYSPNGSLAYNKDYNLNYKFNWTTFNYSETFTAPFASKDLASVQYGFIGKDNNFWAGPYGPEITNVNFQLKYSVDPCVSNPLYSPNCPGYLDAFNKLTPKSVTVTEPTVQQITTSVVEPIATSTQPVAATTTQSVAVTSPITNNVSTPNSTQQATQKQNSQPSISTLLSIVTGVQSQVSKTERSVVQQAVQEAIKQAEKAIQDAESFVSKQNQQQQEQQQIQQNLQSTNIQQTFLNSIRQDIFQLPGNNNQRQNTSQSITPAINQQSFVQNLPQTTTTSAVQSQNVITPVILPNLVELPQTQQATSIYSLVQPQPVQQQLQTSSIPTTTVSAIVLPKLDPIPEISTEQKQVIGPTNLLQQFLEQKLPQDNVNQSQQTKQVNQQVRDNELAGQVSLASMAKQPQGFETYMAILRDVPFYKPTEAYPNQRTVDNQRAMRLLSGASDQKHKELVDSQYRR